MKIVKNDLFDYQNRYIYQLEEGFKFSLDSILLAEFVKLNKRIKDVLDMCTGNAPVLLILSTKLNANYVGFEIQEEIYNLGLKSVQYNNLNDEIVLHNDDVKNINKYYSKNYFDVITCNPPYFKVSDMKITNECESLSVARHELKITLEDIFKLTKDMLKENGNFYLVHRPERLDEIILLANKYHMPVKELQLILTKKDVPKLILIRCQNNAKLGMKINAPINITKYNSYQNIFRKKDIK